MNTLIHRLWPLGIRFQLMLCYTAVFAALLLFVGAIFYQYLEHSLEASLDSTLQIRAQQIAGGIVFRGSTITIRDVAGGTASVAAPPPRPPRHPHPPEHRRPLSAAAPAPQP